MNGAPVGSGNTILGMQADFVSAVALVLLIAAAYLVIAAVFSIVEDERWPW